MVDFNENNLKQDRCAGPIVECAFCNYYYWMTSANLIFLVEAEGDDCQTTAAGYLSSRPSQNGPQSFDYVPLWSDCLYWVSKFVHDTVGTVTNLALCAVVQNYRVQLAVFIWKHWTNKTNYLCLWAFHQTSIFTWSRRGTATLNFHYTACFCLPSDLFGFLLISWVHFFRLSLLFFYVPLVNLIQVRLDRRGLSRWISSCLHSIKASCCGCWWWYIRKTLLKRSICDTHF